MGQLMYTLASIILYHLTFQSTVIGNLYFYFGTHNFRNHKFTIKNEINYGFFTPE